MTKTRVLLAGSINRTIKEAALLVLIAALLLAVPFVLESFRVYQIATALAYVCILLGLNYFVGQCGQVSFGHVFFVAIGAYISAAVSAVGWHSLVSISAAGVACFVLGFLIGRPILRLEGIYLGLVTLGLSVVVVPLLQGFKAVTGGDDGIRVAMPSGFDSLALAQYQWTYLLILFISACIVISVRRLRTGRTGRSMRAIRGNELAAQAMGVNCRSVKTWMFAISTASAGMGGVMLSWVTGYIAPSDFGYEQSILYIIAIIIGGRGSFAGAVIGAAVLVWMPILSDSFGTAVPGLIFGGLIVLILLIAPEGLVGLRKTVLELSVRISRKRQDDRLSALVSRNKALIKEGGG